MTAHRACFAAATLPLRHLRSASALSLRTTPFSAPSTPPLKSHRVHSPAILRACASAAPPSHPTSSPAVSQIPALLDVLRARALLDNVTGVDDGPTKFSQRDPESQHLPAVYCGFDPTADSLHLGNLLAIMTLAWCQRCGHRPIAIVGGATGRVGDPSGKSAERPVLDNETIERNLLGIEANIRQVLDRSAASLVANGVSDIPELVVLNNNAWWAGMSFLDVLRDIGKYARVGTMLAKDSVKMRLESEDGMSFTEFTYQLLQAYDFLYLSDKYGVRVQLGGSDQWGNITAGIELTRKLRAGRALHGITFPLLTTADGRKFGKSESGAVWLTEAKLSPYEFFQNLFKIPDSDVITFLKRLTFLPLPDIDAIEESMLSPNYAPNSAQRVLAEEVTRVVHGDAGVRVALAATAVANPGGSTALSADALEAVSGDMPSVRLLRADVVGCGVVDVMVAAGLQKSKGEARRLIKGGGGYVNNAKISDEEALVMEMDLVDSRLLLLGAGKKKKLLVRID
jgi:tyrosyl-tRNA synthetase